MLRGRIARWKVEETGRPYATVDVFTAVALYLGAQISWGGQFRTIEKRPGFREFAARVNERPIARRATEKDDAVMAGSVFQGGRGARNARPR